jgi:hypothetical protein
MTNLLAFLVIHLSTNCQISGFTTVDIPLSVGTNVSRCQITHSICEVRSNLLAQVIYENKTNEILLSSGVVSNFIKSSDPVPFPFMPVKQ